MNETMTRGDAEKVSEEEMSPACYIPRHGVYHPQKPGKIRVVFDCTANFQGVSLNDHLLTGPELTNTLVGVLPQSQLPLVEISGNVITFISSTRDTWGRSWLRVTCFTPWS